MPNNGSGYVTFRVFYGTIGSLCAAALTAGWLVMNAHAQAPHDDAVSNGEIQQIEARVTATVNKSEQNLKDQLDKQYEEQKAIDGKLDWIIQQMIEDARARGNTQ